MVNRNSSPAAPLPMLVGRRQFSDLGGVSYGTGSAASRLDPYQNIAAVLARASSHIEDRLDLAARAEGRKEGAIAGGSGIPDLRDETTIRGAAFNAAARDTVATQFELAGYRSLAAFEKEHAADPAGFKAKSAAWLSGVLPKLQNFDPALAQKIAGDYQLRLEGKLSQIEDRARAIARDKQLESALLLQTTLQEELRGASSRLFAANATPEERAKILDTMVGIGARLGELSHQMGPDGRLLFDASDRVKLKVSSQDAVAANVGASWFAAQPDMIGAYDAWKSGKAGIEVSDGAGGKVSVSLKELLGESGYRAAQEDFMGALRSELALDAQIDASRERDFKKGSDLVFQELSTKAQDGAIDLKTVESVRHLMEADKFLSLRALAKTGGASVSDGQMVSQLVTRDAGGEDIRAMARSAYENGALTREDYLRIYTKNTDRLEQGIKDPVAAARDALVQRLGSMSKEIGIAQSSAIGSAALAYETEISDFVTKNGRMPNIRETAAISEDVYGRYSAVDADTSLLSLPLPRSMTQAEKLNSALTSSEITQKINTLTQRKLAEYAGDKDRLAADPDYVREVTLLKKYHDLLKLKEGGNARPAQ